MKITTANGGVYGARIIIHPSVSVFYVFFTICYDLFIILKLTKSEIKSAIDRHAYEDCQLQLRWLTARFKFLTKMSTAVEFI